MADPIDINQNPAAVGTFRPGFKPDTAQPSQSSRAEQQGAESVTVDSHGLDPNYITRMEHFEGIAHEEIYQHAQDMKPELMTVAADTWVNISANLSGGLIGAHLSIQKALADGVEGRMADAAVAAAQSFYNQASEVERVILAVGHRMRGVAHAAEVVKMSVPPPAGPLNGPGSPDRIQGVQLVFAAREAGLASSADSDEVSYQRGVEALHRTAIDTMNNAYKPSYGPAGTGVPTFVAVQAPGEDGTTVPGNTTFGTTGTTGSTGDQGSANPPGEGETPGGEQPTDTTTASANTPGQEQNPTVQQTGSRAPESPTTPVGAPNNTTTAGVTSPGSTNTGTRSGSPGSPGGPSSPNGGRPGAPQPGKSLPGLGQPGGVNAPAAAGLGSAATQAGRAPGMMGPGPGPGKKDDESSRQTPDYLITNREEELLGRPDPTVPQTIGSDAPSNHPAARQPGERSYDSDQRR
ncbi:hypothetical protein [Nocardia callitridis]|uniref:Uncharacterized protein n=1 Tax=Nocardia callitridis TaxID=648753 RepID=A0ABP9JTB0_9NOCA